MFRSPTKTRIFDRARIALAVTVLLLGGRGNAGEQQLTRLIEIEFDPVVNARQYQIKATPLAAQTAEPLTYTSDKNEFSQALPLGPWQLEVRSFDRRGVAGRWQSIGDINLGFKPARLQKPNNNSVKRTIADETIPVTFEWEAFHVAAVYTLTVKTSGTDKTVVVKDVQGGKITCDLKQGNYTWNVKSKPPAGVSLDGVDPDPMLFSINAGKLDDPVIAKPEKQPPRQIDWRTVEFASSYEIKMSRIKNSMGATIAPPIDITSKITNKASELIPDDLEPGIYKFTVIAKADGFDDSRPRSLQFRISGPETSKKKSPESKATASLSTSENTVRHRPVDFLQGSVGPVLWSYSFASSGGQSFDLVAGTVTALSADINKWFLKDNHSAWAMEIRGRQTNIYLFENSDSKAVQQDKVTVADRRIALLGRRRKIIDRVGIDAILGIGSHHFTYLIQDERNSVVSPVEGELLEVYLGGAIDWQLRGANHASFDLTFHPVGTSIGISTDQTWQYTASLRYINRAVNDRSFVSFSLENFRSRINTHSEKFTGTAETISNWYRVGAGLALKI